MTAPPTLSRAEARRIAIRAQLLDAEPPSVLLVRSTGAASLQIDPTAIVPPAADHVAWSRLGNGYDPAQLTAALEQDRTLFEHKAQPTLVEGRIVMIRPMADLPPVPRRDGRDAGAAFRRRAGIPRRQ